jgi:glycosyltransferase involved in cell wall biosynthesis
MNYRDCKLNQKIVLMILNQQFPPDIRVEQEYDALKSSGYRVVVVASEGGSDNKNYEIIRINPYTRWSQIFNFSLTHNPMLTNLILNELTKLGIRHVDVIHVHDLLWSFLGFQLKKCLKSKVIIDLHENYPEAIRDAIGESGLNKNNEATTQKIKEVVRTILQPRNIVNYLSKWAYNVQRLIRYESKMLQKCDHFIVVVDEALERFKKKEYYKKGIVVSNTKDPKLWKFESIPEMKEKLVICYVGSVQNLRGLDTAILAMKYLNQKEYEFNLVGIIGDSQIHNYFRHIIKQNNISNVNLIEWLEDERDAFSYINNSHICIVPHKDTGLTQTTVPHKLFMYMAIGRPVLVSDVAPLRRIVSDVKNGLIFKANDPIDLANKLKQLRDESRLLEFAHNGRHAAENQYSWSRDKDRLIALYSDLIGTN